MPVFSTSHRRPPPRFIGACLLLAMDPRLRRRRPHPGRREGTLMRLVCAMKSAIGLVARLRSRLRLPRFWNPLASAASDSRCTTGDGDDGRLCRCRWLDGAASSKCGQTAEDRAEFRPSQIPPKPYVRSKRRAWSCNSKHCGVNCLGSDCSRITKNCVVEGGTVRRTRCSLLSS